MNIYIHRVLPRVSRVGRKSPERRSLTVGYSIEGLNGFQMIHDPIYFSNLKSLFFKVVEDSDKNPTPLESSQSEFGQKSYDQNIVICLFLRERPVRPNVVDRSSRISHPLHETGTDPSKSRGPVPLHQSPEY